MIISVGEINSWGPEGGVARLSETTGPLTARLEFFFLGDELLIAKEREKK